MLTFKPFAFKEESEDKAVTSTDTVTVLEVLPSAAVTTTETVLLTPATKAVPETTTEAPGSAVTAFTKATLVLAGTVTVPPSTTT